MDDGQRLQRELDRRTREVGVLKRVAGVLNGTLDLPVLLDGILAAMHETFGFAHAMILLADPGGAELTVAASRGYPTSGIGAVVRVGEGVIGVVARRRKLMRTGGLVTQRNIQAASRDPAAETTACPALPGLPDAQSVVAIPLLGRDQLIAVLAVESENVAVFDDEDLGLIEAVASQAGLAIHNARLLQAEKEQRAELQRAHDRLMTWNEAAARFVPYEFLEILGHQQLPDVRRGDVAHKLMSVFVSDIRGYTTIVESQGPQENFDWINEYLSHMEVPIHGHAGVIESYHGDGVLALFPGPADGAVRAAVASLRALAAYNAEARLARGLEPIRIGVGIDTGWLMLGTMGGTRRLAAGVIGDCANTASRVESATKLYGASVLITERTRDALTDPGRWQMRPVDKVRPKGKKNPVVLYEVLDGLPDDELSGKLRSRPSFEAGWALYQEGSPGEALVHFAEALRLCRGDRAAQVYVGRCWHLIERGVPDHWDGVMDLTEK